MAEYQRFVAYVYEYIEDEKGNNRGFIKVEAREGVCKMAFHLIGTPNLGELPCKIYAFVRKSKECIAIFLGNCNLASDLMEYQVETQEEHIAESNYSLKELAGIIILGEHGRMYATQWDEQPILLREFLFSGESVLQQKKEEAVAKPEFVAEVILEAIPEAVAVAEAVPEAVPEAIPKAIPKAETVIIAESVAKVRTEAVPEPEITMEEVKEKENTFSPFADGDTMQCIKIVPRELRYLSRRDTVLANNNFLLHGFYNYRHLLLGQDGKSRQYILGIPGIYEPQERLMAGMFGFSNFKAAPNIEKGGGKFGYWYRLIDAPKEGIWNRR